MTLDVTGRSDVGEGATETPSIPGSDVSALTDVDLPSVSDPGFDLAAWRARCRLENLITDGSTTMATLSRACAALVRLHAVQQGRSDAACGSHLDDLRAFGDFALRLDRFRADELFDAGAREMCSSMGFQRTLFSVVSDAMWSPRFLFLDPSTDADTTELRSFVADATWGLDSAPLESEVVRRRRPQLVPDPQTSTRTFKQLMRISQTRSYAVAPIRVRRRVVGLLHADRWGEPITPEDLARVEAFAQCFGSVVETAALRRRLSELARRWSDDLISAAADIAAFDGEERILADLDPLVGAGPRPGHERAAMTAAVSEDGAERDHALAALSPREADVLLELTRGQTNAQIATRLCVAEGTVKSYVKGVLRKLDVPSRAAAAAYLRGCRTGLDARAR